MTAFTCRNGTSSEYIARASKVVTLVDLAGHEKYFRTTAYGLTGVAPLGFSLMIMHKCLSVSSGIAFWVRRNNVQEGASEQN